MRYTKYFERARHLSDGGAELRGDGSISPYDDLVRRAAEAHGFDWRLVVAQMYQESRFDPDAESWAGARDLMQVLPRTAQELGIDDLHDPEKSVEAGLRYLEWVRERFPASLDPAERMWFTLAGYNAGHGHVRDARRLARRLGHDPDRWFGHVERAMLKLSEPEYANRARHGFVRGREPVQYVRAIRDRYQAYVDLLRRRTR
jgi:membrane-bound lytic murein transglycosylase F